MSTLPILVFAGVFGVVWGAYWLFVMRDENRMIARLQPKRQVRRENRTDVLKTEETMSSVGGLNAALRGMRLSRMVQQFLTQAGMSMSVSVFLLLTVCLGGLVVAVGLLRWGSLTGGLLLAPVAASGPYFYVRWRRSQRIHKFEEQLPEGLDLIARALRAGHSLPTGLSMVADELPAPMGTEFRILFEEQNFGLSLPNALRNFAQRVPVIDARFFVTAVLTQREVGGNLAEVIDNLCAVVRERFKIKRQIRVLSAHGRITGWVLGMLPPALAGLMMVLNPNHLASLAGDPLGQRMIGVAIALQILGMLAVRKLVDIEY